MRPDDPRLLVISEAAKVRPPHVFFVWHMIAVAPAAFSAAACSAFAKLEERYVVAIVEALELHSLFPRRALRGKSPERGTRLPPAMALPDDWLAYAQERRRWDRATTEDVLADFIEHWSNRTDTRAAKIDWTKTWQTWVRRDRRPDGSWSPNTGEWTPERQRQSQVDAAALYRKLGRDSEADEIDRGLSRAG